MTTFLQHVAQHLIATHGTNLSNLTIVLPGQRASLFMNELLVQAADGPVWAPQYATIDELFMQLSDLKKAQPIRLVCMLHDIYRTEVPNPMSLDDFYGWGEILLSDFDDIDKHLVDAEKLFCNAEALQQMQGTDFLDDAQTNALRNFFSNFNEEQQTTLQQRFKDMWQAMPRIYRRFNEQLSQAGFGYTGAIYRRVAEQVLREGLTEEFQRHYAFVGFNVLDDVEEVLFSAMRDNGWGTFYWDYDDYYFRDEKQEAGLFMRSNVKKFPNALPDDIYNNLQNGRKTIRFIATGTDNAQVRYVPQWLKEKLTAQENESAVVLCDESLVQPLLNTIPSKAECEYAPNEVNITMGFPLHQTPIHGYLMALLDLQTYGYDQSLQRLRTSAVSIVQNNAFYAGLPLEYKSCDADMLQWLADEMEQLSQRINDGSIADDKTRQLYTESAFQCYCTINQFAQLIGEGLAVQRRTLYRLMRRAMQSISVPFHGEMNRGLQVMGLLEARNLDFRHLVMLSVGEGFLPKKADDTSLIPYCLKPVFNLSTIERKTAVFAYYFYRTIQRTEDLTLIYNDNSSGTAQREQSRFLRQLLAETNLNIACFRLEPEVCTEKPINICIQKTPQVMKLMSERFDRQCGGKNDLSPSALGTYLTCPVKFFYQNVAAINVPRHPEEGIDAMLFGTLFHDSAEMFYSHLRQMKNDSGQVDSADYADVLCQDDSDAAQKAQARMLLGAYVDLSFWVNYFYADQYDAYTKRKERETFLDDFMQCKGRAELLSMVNAIYAEHSENAVFSGMPMIVRDVVVRMLQQLLQWDALRTPFEMYGLEQSIHDTLAIETADGKREIRVGGRADRMDIMQVEGQRTLRIVDYKTGSPTTSGIASIKDMFSAEAKGNAHYYLQTFLYAAIMRDRLPDLPVCPSLFYVRGATDAEVYTPLLKLNKKQISQLSDEMITEYKDELTRCIAEIFNPEIPFTQTAKPEDNCKYCDFRQLCGKMPVDKNE